MSEPIMDVLTKAKASQKMPSHVSTLNVQKDPLSDTSAQ